MEKLNPLTSCGLSVILTPTMSRHSTFALYDRIHGGSLSKLLPEWRTEGASLQEISFRLREMDVHAGPKTVSRWLSEIEFRDAVA